MNVEKTMEFLLDQQAHLAASLSRLNEYNIDAGERHDRERAALRHEMSGLRAELRRAVRLSVEEARRERERRHEMYAELSATQKLTEEKLQRLIDLLTR
jgi:hypothetical protein